MGQLLIEFLITLLCLAISTGLTYVGVKLYCKINSKKLKEEFTWFHSKQYRKILKEYGLDN